MCLYLVRNAFNQNERERVKFLTEMEQIPLKWANSSEVINFYLFEHNVSGIGNFRLGRFYWRFTGHLCYRYIFYYFPNKILYLINPPVPEIWRPSGHGYGFLCHNQQVIFNIFIFNIIFIVLQNISNQCYFAVKTSNQGANYPSHTLFLSFRYMIPLDCHDGNA